jgi:hypothetical protein
MKSLKTTWVVAGRGGGQPGVSGERFDARLFAIAVVILVAMLIIIGPARPVAAVAIDDFSIVIPIDDLELEDEGSITPLASAPVGAEYVGQTCTVTSIAENQESIHPGNNLTVASGSSVVVLEDVESGANVIVTADGVLVLGTEIVVSLVMGPDEVFSAGLEVHINCSAVEETTTTTTTTIATTTTTVGVGSTSLVSPPEETTSTVDDSVGGTVITSTTVADEVEDLVVLPFTGPHDGALLFLVGSALAVTGILIVGRKREDSE